MNRQQLTGWVEFIILVGIMWLLTKMMKLIILILKIKFGREGNFFKTFSGSNVRCVAWQTVSKQFYDGFNWFSLWFAMVLTLSFRSDAKTSRSRQTNENRRIQIPPRIINIQKKHENLVLGIQKNRYDTSPPNIQIPPRIIFPTTFETHFRSHPLVVVSIT